MDTKPLNSLSTLKTKTGEFLYYSLADLAGAPAGYLERLPFSVRILLEGMLRHLEGSQYTLQDMLKLAKWQPIASVRQPVPFYPGRVVMQDLSGVPVMNDLAAMRAALVRMGGHANQINPCIPVDLIIDHSIQVDFYASADALERNTQLEFDRNQERYQFLHWCQKAFDNFRVVPPSSGIIHQVNLESLTRVVLTQQVDEGTLAYPETLVGTDSHTTMINGLGVSGWGVGGIEAVSAMLGLPIEILTPDVIGFKLTGRLVEGVTPTDLTLTIVEMLRKVGVVEKFVEFYGAGLDSLALADRAMIANMTPETGATMLYFPVDQQTLDYLILTGRGNMVDLVETYCKAQSLFRSDETPDPSFTLNLELDLSTVEPSLAGPKRPQDRIDLSQVKESFHQALTRPKAERGYALPATDLDKKIPVRVDGSQTNLKHGSVVIAAITSCTNTSNPFVMVGAGLLAKKAVEKGLKVGPTVKTSLAPGSKVVTGYLQAAGLMEPLSQLGFDLVGYGCTTCIGNSGPLAEPVSKAISENGLVAAAVISGNRNFEGRVHPNVQANYLASPPLVVAYALAGTVDIDLVHQPLGTDTAGQSVFLKDIWPSSAEIQETIQRSVQPELFDEIYQHLYDSDEAWKRLPSPDGEVYPWNLKSTYLQEPPFFKNLSEAGAPEDIHQARVLVMVGDSTTTDHISPAGNISPVSAAGKYLLEHGVPIHEFNSYGSRRGNDQVLTRGTFGNIRIKNLLLQGVEGSFTLHFPDQEQMSIYDAAMQYQDEEVPLIVLAGKEYGTGSSRDWAAKGALQLGVKAILAESYERIHRSNLVGMGVLPLQFKPGENAASLGLTGHEIFDIEGIVDALEDKKEIKVKATREDGSEVRFTTIPRIETSSERTYYLNGGILNTILLDLLG